MLPAVILGGIGLLYPTLKPNPDWRYGDDFTPFKYTYDGASWEGVIYLASVCLMLSVAGFIVMKISDRTTRDWGVFSIFYLFLYGLVKIIAMNADTEWREVWSFGSTLWTIGFVIVSLLLLEKMSKYFIAHAENANTDFQ